ncbi:hypothetical protein L0Y40_01450 [Candidatus Wolfebacteria bacterium]|nr:hypothetical protein [Candidatus Wolfebacteria bacterium]
MNKVVSVLSLLLDFLLPHRGARKVIETISTETFLANAAVSETYLGENELAALRYRDPLVRAAVWALKYQRSRRASTLLAEALARELMEHLGDRALFESGTRYLLAPVPLSPVRLRERGFNQATLLAEALSALHPELSLTLVPDILIRTRDTAHQTALKRREERIANVQGCFAVPDPKRVRGKDIIVLDDVTTTGATMNEARWVLTDAGARSVITIAAAH